MSGVIVNTNRAPFGLGMNKQCMMIAVQDLFGYVSSISFGVQSNRTADS